MTAPLLLEDFSRYADRAAMMADSRYESWGDRNADRIQLDTRVVPPGASKSMRYDWPANAPKDYELGRVLDLPAMLSTAWFELWLRFSSTFTNDGPQSGNDDFKMFFGHTVPDGSGRVEVKWLGSTLAVGEAAAGSQQEIDTGIQAGDWWNERWMRLRFLYQVAPQGRGRIRLWHPTTGALAVDRSNLTWSEDYQGIDKLYFGANMNRGTGHEMSMWWGPVTVYDRDPGWGSLARLLTVPSARYARGHMGTTSAAAIPATATKLHVGVMRDGWPDTSQEVIKVRCHLSLDGGATWAFLAGFGARGGIHQRRDGLPTPESRVTVPLPGAGNPNRQVRCEIECREVLDTSLTVEAA